ncbi:unnamed protein product [Peniophora sp. CBMAI 1063]|nr:unnamed protein product [Peniophora sp. CBMAI 1063]
MRTTKRGRPFLRDTLDLFAAFAVSLQFSEHRRFFRSFPNSFDVDDAAQTLASLTLSQSHCDPDPSSSSRFIPSTSMTTFSMTRDMAKATCQHLMDARLIEDAADPSSHLFKDRGVYVLTPKGLHVLERFIERNGISDAHLRHVFAGQPICTKIFHLERHSIDDEILVTQPIIYALFRRFVGREANHPPETGVHDPSAHYSERSRGIELMTVPISSGGPPAALHRHCFMSLAALEWLCDFTSVLGREQAAEMAAQFVRFGLITLVSDTRKKHDSVVVFTVHGSVSLGSSLAQQTGEFHCSAKAIYKITEEGCRIAHWKDNEDTSLDMFGACMPESLPDISDDDVHLLGRLRFILDQPQLRELFNVFLRDNSCEANLGFFVAVEDLKHAYAKSASVDQSPAERHQEALVQRAFEIYRTYLAPSSPSELEMDEDLLKRLPEYLSGAEAALTSGTAPQSSLQADQLESFNTTQVLKLIIIYEGMQAHAFRSMATDWVPKFTRTSQFAELCENNEKLGLWSTDEYDEFQCSFAESSPSTNSGAIQDEEVGGA